MVVGGLVDDRPFLHGAEFECVRTTRSGSKVLPSTVNLKVRQNSVGPLRRSSESSSTAICDLLIAGWFLPRSWKFGGKSGSSAADRIRSRARAIGPGRGCIALIVWDGAERVRSGLARLDQDVDPLARRHQHGIRIVGGLLRLAMVKPMRDTGMPSVERMPFQVHEQVRPATSMQDAPALHLASRMVMVGSRTPFTARKCAAVSGKSVPKSSIMPNWSNTASVAPTAAPARLRFLGHQRNRLR